MESVLKMYAVLTKGLTIIWSWSHDLHAAMTTVYILKMKLSKSVPIEPCKPKSNEDKNN
jgi:hypothetical protein